jgi:hypothetical protein
MSIKRIIPISIAVVVLVCAIFLVFSYMRGERTTADKQEITEATVEETSRIETSPTPTLQPTKKPTPRPTVQPTPTLTPTPTPVSVYIPREDLPDGRLFDQEYYAVLPGEGAYYNIFDCYGNQIDSFFYDTEYGDEPIGLLTIDELSHFHLLNTDTFQVVEFTDQEYWHTDLTSNKNGFYQMWYGQDTQKVVMFNEEGKHIRTLSFEDESDQLWELIDIACQGEEMVVIYMSYPREGDDDLQDITTTVYFVGKDGTINDLVKVDDYDFELFARKYLGPGYEGDTITDLNGKVLIKDVTYYEHSMAFGYPDSPLMVAISDYFMKDGKVYDESFLPVKKDTVSTDGNLIYGVDYDVAGISCTAAYSNRGVSFYWWDEDSELTAIGYTNNQIGVKRNQGEYVLDMEEGQTFCGINQYVYLLRNEEDGAIQIVSLETREVLNTISGDPSDIVMADEYFLMCTGNTYGGIDGSRYIGFILYDKDGNRRYAGEEMSVMCMPGEYIMLYRGPYVGVADLNGEWIMKTLTWEMTRDAEEVEYSY